MIRRNTARACGAARLRLRAALASPSGPAQVSERTLAGIRLNTNSRSVLGHHGNPTQRSSSGGRLPRPRAAGRPAWSPEPPASPASAARGTEGRRDRRDAGGFRRSRPRQAACRPWRQRGPSDAGAVPGFPAPPAVSRRARRLPRRPGRFPGSPSGSAEEGYPGGGVGGAAGPFGNTTSSLARSQEVTWIYDRPGRISYEFLIGADGRVIQIKVIGYGGKGATVRTTRGIGLGSTYAQVQQKYGYPEQFQQASARSWSPRTATGRTPRSSS